MKASAEDADLIKRALEVGGGGGEQLEPGSWLGRFQTAMENDLDTPGAVEVMLGVSGEIISAAGEGGDVTAAKEVLGKMGDIFGMRIGKGVEERVVEGWGEHMGRFG